jgi:ATP-dependent RNA helicase RhlE
LTSFLELGLAEPITRALVDEQYVAPTPIQAQTIPRVLEGRDVIGIAQTGTGKTAAFALPILNHIAARQHRPRPRTCRVLVLSPTRELSSQIVASFKTYGRYLRPSVALAIGGVNIRPQARALTSGVDVLVATPGRLLDLITSRAVTLDGVEVFVLDEADRMLDMGFIHEIRRIVAKLPTTRQTLFFSATMPREITELANAMLRDPVHVAVTPAASTVERIAQRVILVDRAAKPALLAELLRSEPIDRVLVFTRTKHGADKVVRSLANSEITAAAIHGNKSQNQRERVLADFRSGKLRTLIATDIAARGIDVDGVSHVVNFDLPNVPESYVHRIGRTARAGADGIAISFCDGEERAYLRDIEKLIRIAIPATDRRSHRHESPRANGNGGKPHRARHAKGDSTDGQGANGRGANGHDANASAAGHGAKSHGPDDHSKKTRKFRKRRRGGPQQHQHADNGHQHRHSPPRHGKSSDGSIESVGFMRPAERHKRRPGGLAARRPAR